MYRVTAITTDGEEIVLGEDVNREQADILDLEYRYNPLVETIDISETWTASVLIPQHERREAAIRVRAKREARRILQAQGIVNVEVK
jgi:hypothetical protein